MFHLNHHDRDIESPWLRARLAMLPAGSAILDVGCVEGWVLDEYPEAMGVDSRPAPARWAGRFILCDAEAMPPPGDEFDAVVSVSTLEHVGLGWYGDPAGDADKPGRVVAEMARVLRPGGWLLLTVPLWLTMTKDGRPFAREIDPRRLELWLAEAGMVVREWLTVSSEYWTAAPDDRGGLRQVALIAAEKVAP